MMARWNPRLFRRFQAKKLARPSLSSPRTVAASLRRRALAGVIVAVGLAGGCTSPGEWVHNHFKVGPNYERPPVPVAKEWIDAKDPRVQSVPANYCAWWKVFNDPILDALIQTAYEQNLNVKIAGTRVLQARARRGIAVGNLFPQTQTWSGSYTHNEVSRNVANREFIPQAFYDNWKTSLNASWELDFWGRFRRNIEAANAEFDASIEDYDSVLVTLLSDVATNYIILRTTQEQIKLARENVQIQEGSLKIAQDRFRGGATTELDVQQAISQLEQTKALIPPLEITLRDANNELCILLGQPPHDLVPELGRRDIPTTPPEVAVGVPADLLRRRPDVQAAERRVAAQSARIGVAEADLYPAFSINGVFGFEAENFGDLFASKSMLGSIGPSFQWNILNYGRILNNVRVQDSRFQELALTYQNAVLTAAQEVENGLVGFLQTQEQAIDLKKSVDAVLRSYKLVLLQYEGGQADYNRVFVVEGFLVQQQLQFAQAQGNIALNLVSVYRALGGGWEIRCPKDGIDVPAPVVVQEIAGPAKEKPADEKPAAPMPAKQ